MLYRTLFLCMAAAFDMGGGFGDAFDVVPVQLEVSRLSKHANHDCARSGKQDGCENGAKDH